MKKIAILLICSLTQSVANAGLVPGTAFYRIFAGANGTTLLELDPFDDAGVPLPDTFHNNDAGAYLHTALFGLGGELAELRVTGDADPFAEYTLQVTNGLDVAIDLSSSVVLETIASNGVPIMTSTLMATYVDNDGSGGINSTVTHRAFPQHQTLGGFQAQVLTHTFTGAGVANAAVGPETPSLPPFYPFPNEPFTKINTQLDVTNLLPGDSLVITGRTDTVVVPEPSAFLFLGLVGLLVGSCRFFKTPNNSHSQV